MIHVGVEADLLDIESLGVVNVGHRNEHQLKFPIHDRNVSMGLTILAVMQRLAPGSVGDLVEGVDELWWFGDVEVGVQAEQVDGEHVRGGRAEQPTPRASPPWWPTSPARTPVG